MTFQRAADQPLPGDGFGVLRGGASPYPVVDGVPILLRGRVTVRNHVTGDEEAGGPDTAALVALIETGHSLDALLALLTVTPSPQWRGSHIPGSGRLLSQPRIGALARWIRRQRLRAHLGHGRRAGTLAWWSELFHTRSQGIDGELVHYFRHRTTQPRYLAAHAAARPVLASTGVVLDLACGYGHLSRDIAAGPPTAVVGVDRTFFQLWLATHFVAPGARFVCADASTALPLADGSIAAVICSDAFHLLPNAETILSELLRVCPDGPVVLTRVGNLDHEPHEGLERSAGGWAALISDHHHLITDEDRLVRHYLDRTTVTASTAQECAEAKWLTLLLSGNPDTDLAPEAPDGWPHDQGHLHINPLYTQHPRADGGLDLELTMPSSWYEFENNALRGYHPAAATVSAAAVRALSSGTRTPEIDRLITDFVVIGRAPIPS
jgi:SAM-dependent methyltransferase